MHKITRELTTAAAGAAGADARVRSELRYGDTRVDSADHLYVTVRASGNEAGRRAALANLLQTLGAVATRNGLTQDAAVESGGLLRFSYRRGGVVTHTIHLVSPIAVRAAAPAAGSSAGARGPDKSPARLAIILDDLGGDRAAADAVFALRYPLTLSVLPGHPHSAEIAEEAYAHGYQVMLHLPMQSVAGEKAEAAELHPGLAPGEVASLVTQMLDSIPHVAGVNNHQGSQATANTELMSALMPVLRERGLFYIDSRTTAATVAFASAQHAGVPAGFRNVPFLDDVAEVDAVRRQLTLAIDGAKQKGEAIAIGHPHAATLRALGEILPELEAQGVRLVYASELVH
ncbi:MAG: divergent polysaccharide deacetylase family protein [Acidobacteriia bacterium]|nr:divergent polysaccharide deacetylase family protein [Terriglobia bacterium]